MRWFIGLHLEVAQQKKWNGFLRNKCWWTVWEVKKWVQCERRPQWTIKLFQTLIHTAYIWLMKTNIKKEFYSYDTNSCHHNIQNFDRVLSTLILRSSVCLSLLKNGWSQSGLAAFPYGVFVSNTSYIESLASVYFLFLCDFVVWRSWKSAFAHNQAFIVCAGTNTFDDKDNT